jgi:outer membrane lipoprotein SlyB
MGEGNMAIRSKNIAWVLLIVGFIFAPLTGALAQNVRHGVVTSLTPVKNRDGDETDTTKQKRTLGKVAGGFGGMLLAHKAGSNVVAGGAAQAAPGAGGEAATKIGSDGPAAHYVVQIKMDDGKVVSLVMAAEKVKGIEAGQKVAVSGDGDSATLKAE